MESETPTPERTRLTNAAAAPLPARNDPPSIYSVPRRFDIATLLVVSLAYSLLFAGMKLLNAHWSAFAFVGGLTAAVAAAQVFFERPSVIRAMSIIVGLTYCLVWAWSLGLWWILPAWERKMLLGNALFVGPFVGYIVGVLDAGLFLIADKVRRRWFSREDDISDKTPLD